MRDHVVSSDKLSVTCIRTRAELREMSEGWEALLERSHSNTIFLTPDWVLSWIEAYGATHELCVLRVDRGGRLIGLALISIRSTNLGLFNGKRVLTFATDGSGESEYLDLICEPGLEEVVVQATLDACRETRRAWDLLRWNEIPISSSNIPHIRRWLRDNNWYVDETKVPCAFVLLPETWDEYLAMLKPRMRSKVRALLRRLDNDHSIVFGCRVSEDEIPGQLRSLFALHGARWRLKGRDGVFDCNERRAFYERLSQQFFKRGWLRLYSLTMDGRFVAHQFCLERNGTVYLLQEGFDPAWAHWGVGNMLRACVLRDAIARGVSRYDFLGGETPHKESWSAQVKYSLRIAAAPPGLPAAAYFLPRRVSRWMKVKTKNILAAS